MSNSKTGVFAQRSGITPGPSARQRGQAMWRMVYTHFGQGGLGGNVGAGSRPSKSRAKPSRLQHIAHDLLGLADSVGEVGDLM